MIDFEGQVGSELDCGGRPLMNLAGLLKIHTRVIRHQKVKRSSVDNIY